MSLEGKVCWVGLVAHAILGVGSKAFIMLLSSLGVDLEIGIVSI